jgi:hypothetical protein
MTNSQNADRYRALCAELLKAVDEEVIDTNDGQRFQAVIDRVRAELAHIGPMVDGMPCDFTRTLLRPAYEPGDGSADGAQLVNLAWWHPAMKRDSLQIVVENARAIIARQGRSAVAPVAVEALQRLRRWGGFTGSTGYSADVVLGVVDWIDGGMTGPLPPLPDYIAARATTTQGSQS